MTLDERKKKVLQAIIRDYISTAEPVGSRTIAKKYELGVSPATIRNEMADLEELGYIEQPYTSAGRIPSDKGYRYYVDCLMGKKKLSEQEEGIILGGYKAKVKDMGTVLRQTNSILSGITNYTSIVMGPQFTTSNLRYVQLVPLDSSRALVLVVTDSGLVQNKILELPQSVNEVDLQKISQVMNAKLQGVSLDQIKLTLIKEIYYELSKHKHIFEAAMDMIQETLDLNHEEKVYLAGTLNILNQPEFRDLTRVRTLLSLLEQDKILKEILNDGSHAETGISVTIGAENRVDGLQDCSTITATYQIDGRTIGSVGIIGPTRMDYEKAVCIVEFMTSHLSKIMKDFYNH
ncbi:heat-inducible transcriptional repressor HrcA [Phosphitispora fastidiosa]|uniref:heat-inducible transcriptional repressor HrcA n=1 Tax=Phosphitispora fastidiosa TaxID=2837202 RepID=UPI001E56938D|nr:heat-inducible transcriptional repressor HrcA [Phosphitispora fastidiosa]MBU7005910.1 heat-inducible transcriptional repressor [Phosphitispora fastidiosa]